MSVGRTAVLAIAWLGAVLGLVILSQSFGGESTRFIGIADDQEQTIRFRTAVEIISYGFVSGQEVAVGDLILEARRPELEAELLIIAEKIHALNSGNRESRASMEAEIVRLQADLQAELTELDSEVRTNLARRDAARTLMSGFGSETTDTARIDAEIQSLRTRRDALRRAAQARIDDLGSRLAATDRPIDAQIAELAKRRTALESERAELRVFAEVPGRVGSVLFQVGETVPPFQPVLTVHGSRPTFIKGYIHEGVSNDVEVNQRVWVRPANSLARVRWYDGTVKGLGSRMVEFPERLKINPLAQAWGREVVVSLAGDHELLLGEKVEVRLDRPDVWLGVVPGWFAELFATEADT